MKVGRKVTLKNYDGSKITVEKLAGGKLHATGDHFNLKGDIKKVVTKLRKLGFPIR